MRRGGILTPQWQSSGVTAASSPSSSSVKIVCPRRRRRKTENFLFPSTHPSSSGQDDRKTRTEGSPSDGRPNLDRNYCEGGNGKSSESIHIIDSGINIAQLDFSMLHEDNSRTIKYIKTSTRNCSEKKVSTIPVALAALKIQGNWIRTGSLKAANPYYVT
ncbi:hypothetical protein QTP88_026622 [Uroleucon formosanum]